VATRRPVGRPAPEEPDHDAGPDEPEGADGRRSRWWARLALAGALVPVVAAAGRAVTGGWVPVGDPALVAVGAADVLDGGSVPGVGPWAATSVPLGVELHHPGPLLFDALAWPLFWGGDAGLALGAALINAVAVVGIFVATRRLVDVPGDTGDSGDAGPNTAALAMMLVAVLCWVMGLDTLIEPGYPGTVVLPFLWFLVLVWAVLCGRRWCLPWACAVGALVGGTDLRFALLVVVLLVVAALAVAVGAWGLPVRHWWSALGALVVSALVVAVGLAQPVAEEAGADGPGNIVRLWRAVGDVPTLAAAPSARVLARVVALPPWWVRPWHADDLGVGPAGTVGPPLLLAVVGLVGLSVAGVLRLREAHRRRDRVAASGIGLAFAVSGLAFATALLVPTTRFGTAVPQLRWLWGAGVFVSLVLFVAGYRGLKPVPGGRWWPAAACATVTLVAAVGTLTAGDRGATATPAAYRVARSVTDQVAAADLDGPMAVICDESLLDPYCEAVLAELAVERVPLEGDADRTLVVAAGDAAARYTRGWRVIARYETLTHDEADELDRLREVLESAIASGDITLNHRGREVAARGDLESVDPDRAVLGIDAGAATALREELFGAHRRDLVAMVAHELVSGESPWPGALRRYRDLQDRADAGTVVVAIDED
jgi:hypothetical protein